MTLRVGVTGVGTWARKVHIPALIAHPDVELVGLWGRDGASVSALASHHGLRAFDDFNDLLSNVDIVDLAIVPAVQPQYARRAAEAGRHMLLEKPVGATSGGLEDLSNFVAERGLSAVIFLTRLFEPGRALWLQKQVTESWTQGEVEWVSGNFLPGNPFAGEWRDQAGPLLDIGPHIISQFELVLGQIQSVSVSQWNPRGRVDLHFKHDSGAESSVGINMHMDIPSMREKMSFSNSERSVESPEQTMDYLAAFSRAIDELLSQIHATPSVNAAIRRLTSIAQGIHTVQLIEQAQQLAANGIFDDAPH